MQARLPKRPKNIRDIAQAGDRATITSTVSREVNSGSLQREVDLGTLQREVAATPVTMGGLVTNLLRYMLGKFPLPIQRIIIAILTRAGDPQPEELYTSRQQTTTLSIAWGWL